MVARPSEDTEWGTGASRRIEPTEPEKDNGFVGGERTPAKKANWIVGLLSDWQTYVAAIIDSNEEHTYQTPKTRAVTYSPLRFTVEASSGTDDEWEQVGSGDRIRSRVNAGITLMRLDDLPDGAVITRIRVMVAPGTARATSGNRMGLQLFSRTLTWATPAQGTLAGLGAGPVRDDGTANLQNVQQTNTGGTNPFGTQTIAKATGVLHYIQLQAGNDGGSNNDLLAGVEVQFTDPGPRNA